MQIIYFRPFFVDIASYPGFPPLFSIGARNIISHELQIDVILTYKSCRYRGQQNLQSFIFFSAQSDARLLEQHDERNHYKILKKPEHK